MVTLEIEREIPAVNCECDSIGSCKTTKTVSDEEYVAILNNCDFKSIKVIHSKSNTMEEKNKKAGQQEKLSYEELSQAASDLHVQYQKLVAEYKKLGEEYQKAVEALRNRDFDYTSFFLSMLFKVMEHPEMYNDKFVSWCSENIEGALTSFAENTKPKEEEKTDGDEAE